MQKEIVDKIKNKLRKGIWDEAQGLIYKEIENIASSLENGSEKNQQLIIEFNEILYMINQAIEFHDSILLCDMIEYELAPFIANNIAKERD